MLKHKSFKFIIITIIIVYIASYYVSYSGYYEYHLQNETIITNEKIKKFDRDIRSNKEVDLLDYLDHEDKTYANSITNLFYNISDNSTKITRKIMKLIFKKLNYLLED